MNLCQYNNYRNVTLIDQIICVLVILDGVQDGLQRIVKF